MHKQRVQLVVARDQNSLGQFCYERAIDSQKMVGDVD